MSVRFPWPAYRDPWECAVVSVAFDGQDALHAIDADHLSIDAHEVDWSSMELAVQVQTDQPIPDGLDGVSAYALVSCRTTQLRRAYPLTADQDGTHHSGVVRLPRTVLTGKADLVVEVIGEHDGRKRTAGSSLPWSIVVDPGEAPPRPGIPPLQTVWVDFSAGDAPLPARRHTHAHAYVDVTASPPILYLNESIDGLQLLLLAETAKLERRRQRDMLGASIARYVANALFRAAVDQVIPGEDGVAAQGPDSRALRDVCEAVAAELPDTETVDDLYNLVATLPDDPARSAAFWSDVDLALDRMTSVSMTIAQICDEVRRV